MQVLVQLLFHFSLSVSMQFSGSPEVERKTASFALSFSETLHITGSNRPVLLKVYPVLTPRLHLVDTHIKPAKPFVFIHYIAPE